MGVLATPVDGDLFRAPFRPELDGHDGPELVVKGEACRLGRLARSLALA